jgi:hypothetical protein
MPTVLGAIREVLNAYVKVAALVFQRALDDGERVGVGGQRPSEEEKEVARQHVQTVITTNYTV